MVLVIVWLCHVILTEINGSRDRLAKPVILTEINGSRDRLVEPVILTEINGFVIVWLSR